MKETKPDQQELEKKVLEQLKAINLEDQDDLFEDGEELPSFQSLFKELDSAEEVQQGTQFGHWQVIRPIGKGGMSSVYLVARSDGQIRQQAALKVIPAGMVSEQLKERFLRERQILTDLNHPNIAQLYDAGITEKGVPWFVMEYIDGPDIITFCEQQELNIEQKVILFKQVCEALIHAHTKGVVHRDIKPRNLIVGLDKQVKLLDFGIAANEENDSLTMTGSVVGTPGYLSPEQAKGLTSQIDRRSDVFSMGVLLYQLLKNELPFQAESITEIIHKIINQEPPLLGADIPVDLKAITFRCLEKKPADRYPSAKKLLTDLDAYLNGEVVQARKVTWQYRAGKKIKKHPILSAFSVSAAALIVFSTGYAINQTYEALKTVQLAEQHLSIAQEIKARVRRTHMMPKHNVQDEYQQIRTEIEQLNKRVQTHGADVTGLSSFALGSAYLAMNDHDKALEFLIEARNKGWQSTELSAALGLVYAWQWSRWVETSLAVEDSQQRADFLLPHKAVLNTAITHLKEAQTGQSVSAYLAAKLAYIENNLEQAIEHIEQEIRNNPWHYEAMTFAATIYNRMYEQTGNQQGYEHALHYKQLSNEYVQKAIDIGRSDPLNYIQYCQNLSTEVRTEWNRLTKNITQVYQQAVNACEDAIALNTDAVEPYIYLGRVFVDMANYQELNKEPYYQMEAKSYFISQKGLAKHPENAQLLAATVSSLFSLAGLADTLEKQEPELLVELRAGVDVAHQADINTAELLFLQALSNINQALKSNPNSVDFIKKHAVVHRALGIYHEEQTSRYELADEHYDKALASFKKMDELGGKVASKGNVAEMYYNKAMLRNLQGRPDDSIAFLLQAIEINEEVLDITHFKFAVFNNTMQFHYELVETLVENNRPYEQYLDEYFAFVNQICEFDYLEKLHWYIIDDIMFSYQNIGVDTDGRFPSCQAENR